MKIRKFQIFLIDLQQKLAQCLRVVEQINRAKDPGNKQSRSRISAYGWFHQYQSKNKNQCIQHCTNQTKSNGTERERSSIPRPSFHFPSTLSAHGGRKTDVGP
ncbi:hypothetical protein CDL15_Pgr005612 [Punica granatum]|uniref:Uncharacterized protein n=1 Tax=Punica granatum TaxID=22663 RepID=A0A218WF37_PUNGR|nr:hypothetical protein CDL15_Pgr005612 [Punica granatum]